MKMIAEALWLRGCLLLLASVSSNALNSVRLTPSLKTPISALSNGLIAGAASAVLVAHPAPALAGDEVRGTALEPAISQLSEAAYPIVTSISDVSPLSSQFIKILDKKIPAAKATTALD